MQRYNVCKPFTSNHLMPLTDASAGPYPEESDLPALCVVHQLDHLVHQDREGRDAHAVLQREQHITTRITITPTACKQTFYIAQHAPTSTPALKKTAIHG